MPLLRQLLLPATITTTGLIAGLMYSYACSVNPGLAGIPDRAYLQAMQSINTAILNPAFFVCFIGPLLLFPVAAWSVYSIDKPCFWLLVAAGGIYMAGVFGVTIAGNVPLNDRLAASDINSASATQLENMRRLFAPAWNRLHLLRTSAAVVSFVLSVLSLLRIKN